jgi:hypothetical protein
MPEILSRSGVSLYHIEHYWTDANFVKVRGFGLLASIILILLGLGLWLLREKVFAGLRSVKDRLRRMLVIRLESKSTRFDHYSGFALLGSALVVLLVAIFRMPIRCDEAGMYDGVCSSMLPLWAVAYISPNNHVGYALFVWLGHFFWHDSVAGMRIFSLSAWILSVLVLSQIYFELFEGYSVSLIAISMTTPLVMTLGMLARGYALGGLLIYLALRMLLRQRDHKDALLAGVIGSFALWVVPSMLYGIVLVAGVILWRQWDNKGYAFRSFLWFVGTAVFCAMLLYMPIVLVSGLSSLIDNPDVRSKPWADISHDYGPWLMRLFTRLFPNFIAIGGLLLVGFSCFLSRPSRRWIILALLPLAILLLPLLQRVLPPYRTLAYITPLVLIFWAGTRFRRMGALYGGLALIGSVFILWNGTGPVRNNVAGASDTAPDAAVMLAHRRPDTVQTMSYDADYASLRFYLRRAGWNGSVEVSKKLDAPWVFETNFEKGVIPEGYQPTSVSGLYSISQR